MKELKWNEMMMNWCNQWKMRLFTEKNISYLIQSLEHCKNLICINSLLYSTLNLHLTFNQQAKSAGKAWSFKMKLRWWWMMTATAQPQSHTRTHTYMHPFTYWYIHMHTGKQNAYTEGHTNPVCVGPLHSRGSVLKLTFSAFHHRKISSSKNNKAARHIN